jgi:hypothetical protein
MINYIWRKIAAGPTSWPGWSSRNYIKKTCPYWWTQHTQYTLQRTACTVYIDADLFFYQFIFLSIYFFINFLILYTVCHLYSIIHADDRRYRPQHDNVGRGRTILDVLC